MTDEEKQETARQKAMEAQAKANRERELRNRAARVALGKSQPNLIAHGPARS